MKGLIILSLIIWATASPTPQPQLPAIFQDNTIPVVDGTGRELLNLTGSTENLRSRALDLEKRDLSLDYVLYNVVFDGQNSANWEPFLVSGQILITTGVNTVGTPNGANPVDVTIMIGDPWANPIAGSIRYVTNIYFNPYIHGSSIILLPGFAAVDFAYVTSTDTFIEVAVDPTLAASNQLSTFNARSGLLANVYNPAVGGFKIVFGANGAITGTIDLVGRGMISGGEAPYKALISGTPVQRGTGVF